MFWTPSFLDLDPNDGFKVDMPNLVTHLDQTPILEWYVVWRGSKNRYQNDMFLKEVRLHDQNMITILSSR